MNKKITKRVFRIIAIVVLFSLISANMTACSKKDKQVAQADKNNLFVHGLVAVRNDDDKWGYMNEKGEMVIEPQFDQAHGFTANGLAAVGKSVFCGYINTKGEVAIPMKYDQTEDFGLNGLAAVNYKNKWGFINEKGEVVVDCKYDRVSRFMSNGLAAVQVDFLWGMINEKGEIVVEPKYIDIKPCGPNGLTSVCVRGKDDLWGYIDAEGNEVIAPSFRDAYPFSKNGLAAVQLIDSGLAYIDEKGKVVFTLPYNKNAGIGYINTTGIDYAHKFASNGLARVGRQETCTEQRYGYVNEKGKIVLDLIYSKATDFDENSLAVVWDDSEVIKDYISAKLINSSGEVVYEGKCRGFTRFVGDYAWAAKNNKSVKIDKTGKEYATVEGTAIDMYDDGYAIFQEKEGACYIVDKDGNKVGETYREVYMIMGAYGFSYDSEDEYLYGIY